MSNVNIIKINRATQTESLTISSKAVISHSQEDIDTLYDTSFHEIVLNARGKYDMSQYETILSIISPSLSYKFCSMHPKKTDSLIKEYCKNHPKEAEFLANMPDQPTAANYVFLYIFKDLYSIAKESNIYEAFDKYQDFFFLTEDVYKTLPMSFVFSLINFVGQE